MNKEINFSIKIESAKQYFELERLYENGETPIDIWQYVEVPPNLMDGFSKIEKFENFCA